MDVKQHESENCDRVNKIYPPEKTDRKNMIDRPKYLNGNQGLASFTKYCINLIK